MYDYASSAPQIWGEEGGGMCANILPRGNVCQLLVKILPKAGKRPFCNKNIIICIKMYKKENVCQF